MLSDNPRLRLTFDDVLLKPAYSEVLPGETDVSTRLTPRGKLVMAHPDVKSDRAKAIAVGASVVMPGSLLADTDEAPGEQALYRLVGGLRSAMGYVGCATIPEMREKAEFIRQSPQGLRESHVHDVTLLEEPPNYRSS